ncbi:MAG: hypothetical protein WC864_00215 [Ilumatobacteraceae bacterium]
MNRVGATKRLGVVAFLVFTFGPFGASPVAGSCAGPTLSVITGEQEVHPGSVITIEGRWFGDDCYDSIRPPSDEGIIGMPWRDIAIVLVQGSREHLVATGNAGAGYDFSVDVTVPSVAEIGAMSVTANLPAQGAYNDWSVSADQEIQVTAGESSTPVAVARFGPIETVEPLVYYSPIGLVNTSPSDLDSLFDGLSGIWLALGMLAVGFLAGRKLSRQSARS